ncbi:MAG: rhodanese-like domain-containing protein, partial [Desulfobacterales bacterium]
MKFILSRIALLILVFLFAAHAKAESPVSIFEAMLMEANQKTPEISTAEMRKIVAEKSATIIDPRSFEEFAVDHIPGSINIAAKPGTPKASAITGIAKIDHIVQGNKSAPIVVYCNGPHCKKSKKVANKLISAGYTSVRRYQLGMPIWRTLVGFTEIELEGVQYVVEKDQTAVLIDVRNPEAFRSDTVPGAGNIPFNGMKPGKNAEEIKKAKGDRRGPGQNQTTRIIVFRRDGAQARAFVELLAELASFSN